MNFIFLILQLVSIPSGTVVIDGLDSSRCMEQQCVIVEHSAAGVQHSCRLFFLLKIVGSVIPVVVVRQRI